MTETSVDTLKNAATQLRIDSVRSTSEAGSGHPTTCLSAAEIVATLFFGEMRYDPQEPQNPDNDRFVLSKGHAAPILYAAWAEAGLFPREELLKLRRIDTRSGRAPDAATVVRRRGDRLARPGHLRRDRHRLERPPDRVPATAPTCCSATARWRKDRSGKRPTWRCTTSWTTSARSSTSTASARAGQRSSATTWVRSAPLGRVRLAHAWSSTATTSRRSRRRSRRAGPRQADDDPGAHAQGQGPGGDRRQGRLARQGAQEGQGDRRRDRGAGEAVRGWAPTPAIEARARTGRPRRSTTRSCPRPTTSWETRWPRAKRGASRLAAVGGVDERIVALDADVKNSTFSDKFEKAHPDRFFESFIAEQVMVGAAMGLAARGAVAFPSTFACFLTRAARLHPDGGHLVREHQAGRLARRHLDRRRRPVADGARGSRR